MLNVDSFNQQMLIFYAVAAVYVFVCVCVGERFKKLKPVRLSSKEEQAHRNASAVSAYIYALVSPFSDLIPN